MSIHHLGHTAKGGAEFVRSLPPLQEPKNPAIAFVAGFLFGAVGVAIYFKSAKDFLICFGLFIAASILLPGLRSDLPLSFHPAAI